MVMPEGSTLTYEYLSTSSLHDADAEPDGDVDASDPEYHLIYDERWPFDPE